MPRAGACLSFLCRIWYIHWFVTRTGSESSTSRILASAARNVGQENRHVMGRLKPGNDDETGTSAERVAESRDLDLALRAMGSRYSHGYESRCIARSYES